MRFTTEGDCTCGSTTRGGACRSGAARSAGPAIGEREAARRDRAHPPPSRVIDPTTDAAPGARGLTNVTSMHVGVTALGVGERALEFVVGNSTYSRSRTPWPVRVPS
jgi:hypothetical protein